MLISKGFPCGHALAVLLGQKRDIQAYVKPYFTVDYYAKSYAGAIIHPHTIDFASPLEFSSSRSSSHSSSRSRSRPRPRSATNSNDESDGSETLPPSTKRPSGRPKKRRIRTREETLEAGPVKPQKCGRCQKYAGHNKKTCMAAI